MPTAEQVIDEILADPLRHVAGAGGALGYVGLDVPPDILLTPGRVGCHLPWQLRTPTPLADAWLENSFPAWARSILQRWAEGRYAVFGQVIFTRGEDVSQRLYYYVCELQRQGKIAGPEPLIFDIARIPREASRRYSVAALRQLTDALGLDAAALRQGIRRANGLRRIFGGLQATRAAAGSLYERVVRASLFADLTDVLPDWTPQSGGNVSGRVLLLGSVPPDDGLHRAVEAEGWSVVREISDRTLDRFGEPVRADTEDPAGAIAQGWLRQRFLGRDFSDPAERVEAVLASARPDVAIGWFGREDEALAWQVPALADALRAHAVPTLMLTARAGDGSDGAGDEIRAFIRGRRS
ncbi:MAG TPA: 2-hydroxyacyl-CoA dehydratase family protein [Steroidobacteraceae bacterium]|nr:2-hydroxyacyl-CoA dehydratase family protein [Steroidobacteraceae bacterium]